MTISLDEAKAHLKVDYTVDDALIVGIINAATRNAEHFTGTRITQTQAIKHFANFSDQMNLEWPLISVDVIKYIDIEGVEQTLYDSANNIDSDIFQCVRIWRSNLTNGQPYLTLGYGQSWPETRNQPEAVAVTYTAGYSRDMIPDDIRQALLLHIGHLYTQKADSVMG